MLVWLYSGKSQWATVVGLIKYTGSKYTKENKPTTIETTFYLLSLQSVKSWVKL